MDRTIAWCITGLVMIAPVFAGSAGVRAEMLIDPEAPCGNVLAQDHEDFQIAQVAWSEGYLAAQSGVARGIDAPRFDSLLQDLKAGCASDATLSFRGVVERMALREKAAAVLSGLGGDGDGGGATMKGGDGYPPTSAGAEALLRRFLDPSADHRGLTLMLAPDGADYRAAYEEPLASALERRYGPMWRDPPPIRPKRGQTELLLEFATTDELIAGAPILREFPGGYRRVVDQMKPGVPIVRFKFVRPGAALGMAFDGLVHVNGHWVLIPKPWRAAP